MDHKHSDLEPLRPVSEYRLAVDCTRCGARPGRACDMGRGPMTVHLARENKADRWYRRDSKSMPWASEMVAGQCYSTLPGCE